MKKYELILLVMCLFFNGCSYYCRSPVFQSASILEKKDSSQELNGNTFKLFSENKDEDMLSYLDFAIKKGISDKLELGVRLIGCPIFHLSVLRGEGKYQFFKSNGNAASLIFGIAPGLGGDIGLVIGKNFGEKINLSLGCQYGIDKGSIAWYGSFFNGNYTDYKIIFIELSSGLEIVLDNKSRINFCISYPQSLTNSCPIKRIFYSLGFKQIIKYEKIIEK
ncbi:MAG: hypothetical protein ABIB46_00655 [bacterium]